MNEIKYETGVPIPTRSAQCNVRYDFTRLNIGDCICVPRKDRANACSAAAQFKKRTPGFNYTARTMGDVVRIWRISDDTQSS